MKINFLVTPIIMGLTIAYSTGSSAAANDDPVKRAFGHIEGHGRDIQKSPGDQFFVRDVKTDRDGSEHVRFDGFTRDFP